MMALIMKTRVFELAVGKYPDAVSLADTMGVSVSKLLRARRGKIRELDDAFVLGTQRAFPEHCPEGDLGGLFYLEFVPKEAVNGH